MLMYWLICLDIMPSQASRHDPDAETALLPDGWARDVRWSLSKGAGSPITPGAVPEGQRVGLPAAAPVNLHSHTFQRAMAGMTEGRTAGQDSFWTWRTLMYRFLDRLTPEDVQAIAAQAMVEMAESGFAAVAEFHYLHHPVGGGTYADPAEMSAGSRGGGGDGLGLTHLPVIYEQGGVRWPGAGGGQLRFGNISRHLCPAAGRGGQGAGWTARMRCWGWRRIRCARSAWRH
jgi:formimidoylglutamate deiminase